MNKLLLYFLFIISSFLSYSQNTKTDVKSDQQDNVLENGTLPADVNTKRVLEEQLKTMELMEIPNISISTFIFNLLLTAILSMLLGYVYVRYGNSISNRKQFSKNFVILSLTTMLIITVVKSSLALSLGLVGALSIIRFRSAIKEPEELAYLFLAISIGLGLGANQTIITIIALIIILSLITLIKLFTAKYDENQNLYLTIQCNNPKNLSSKVIIDTVANYCKKVDLRRIDETSNIIDISLSVELKSFDEMNNLKLDLQNIEKDVKFTILDNKGIIG